MCAMRDLQRGRVGCVWESRPLAIDGSTRANLRRQLASGRYLGTLDSSAALLIGATFFLSGVHGRFGCVHSLHQAFCKLQRGNRHQQRPRTAKRDML